MTELTPLILVSICRAIQVTVECQALQHIDLRGKTNGKDKGL
jgi:hypothetical protein